MNNILLFICSLAFLFSGGNKLKHREWLPLKIHEPSDVCLSVKGDALYIVSDDGFLFQTDLKGNIIKRSSHTGMDFEAVCADEQNVYAVEEMTRRVTVLDAATLELKKNILLSYSGARNKGFESITYNKKKNCFLLITESDPVYIFELNNNFQNISELSFKGVKDISSATWHNNYIWLLSDEDMRVFKVEPENYSVIKSWNIPVLNPEGICFTGNGDMLITADDLGRLYVFDNPEKQ